MDALTFQSPKLIRRLTFSPPSAQKEKQSILEIDFDLVLKGLDINYDQFVDLCILCGCDYCSTIKGIGPKTALKLIKQYKNLETIISVLKKDKKKYSIPPDWFPQRIAKHPPKEDEEEEKEGEENAEAAKEGEEEKAVGEEHEEMKETEDLDDGKIDIASLEQQKDDEDAQPEEEQVLVEDENFEVVPPLYVQARLLFHQCEVDDGDNIDLKWAEPNEDALKAFLVDRMGFNAERVGNGIKKLKEAQQSKSQKRMDR
jgi:flap endonuclease-1